MKNVNRESSIIVLKDSFNALKNVISLAIIVIIATDINVKFIINFGIVIWGLWELYVVLAWRNRIFYMNDNELIFKRGVLLRKLTNIGKEKITTIDIEETFMQRLFKLSLVKINTETTSNNSEIRLIMNREEAKVFRALLIGKNDEEETDDSFYKITRKELLLYSSTKGNVVFIFGTIFSIVFFLKEFISYDLLVNKIPVKWMILLVTIVLIIIKMLSIIIVYYKYYGFRLDNNEETFIISYGYITKKKYSINKKNIAAVKLKQNIYQRLLKRNTISISAIGYGNEEAEESILFPFIESKYIDEIVNEILPKFKYCGDVKLPHSKARLSYFYKPMTSIIIVGILISLVNLKLIILTIIAIPIWIYRCKYKFDNSCLGYNDKLVYIKTGGFRNRINYIDINYIDSIKFSETYFQRRHNIGTMRIRYKAVGLFDLRGIKGIRVTDKMDF